jgi:hypothetical protein
VISSVAGRHKHKRTRTNFHASSEIRTHNPCVWSGEDISCLSLRGYCDRRFKYRSIIIKTNAWQELYIRVFVRSCWSPEPRTWSVCNVRTCFIRTYNILTQTKEFDLLLFAMLPPPSKCINESMKGRSWRSSSCSSSKVCLLNGYILNLVARSKLKVEERVNVGSNWKNVNP